ncbi:MAG: ComF family protein [Legionellaceae bacterium]|nr:ComF family protein [Legionellaceae bacterium]
MHENKSMRSGKFARHWQWIPRICLLCAHYHHDTYPICDTCYALLPRLIACCIHCAEPLPNADFPICGACSQQKPSFDQAYVAYIYAEPLRGLIHAFKYQAAFYLKNLLGQLLLEAKLPQSAEVIIPIPLHPKRIQGRGFNQTVLLSKVVSRALKIPYDISLCARIRDTQTQAQLSLQDRRKNLQKAFVLKKQIPYQHVLLLDDVLTSGQTLEELASQLKQAGVARVDVCCIARTLKNLT